MNKKTTALITAAIVATGAAGFDYATITPVEKIEAKLAPYNMVLSDIEPYAPDKVQTALESKDFTKNEEFILQAILQGQIPFVLVEGDLKIEELENIYSGLASKLEIDLTEIGNEKNFHKLVRNKFEK